MAGPDNAASSSLTSPAKPGPARDPQPKPAPPPPPKSRWWFLLVGLLATVFLLSLPSMKGTTTVSFNFSTFLARVEANKVSTASIDPNGGVKGKLDNGDDYTSQIPIVLNDPQLSLDPGSPPRLGDGRRTLLEPRGRPVVLPAAAVLRRDLRVGLPERPPAARRRHHGYRGLQGQGLRRATTHHALCRRRRLRGRQAGGERGRRLLEAPGPIPSAPAPSVPEASSWSGLRAAARPSWRAPWRGRPRFPSSP